MSEGKLIKADIEVVASEELERAIAEELNIPDPEPEQAEANLKKNEKGAGDATR